MKGWKPWQKSWWRSCNPDANRSGLLSRADLEVGRDCDGLLLGDPRTSRRHATLMANAGGLSVVDMGSSNGTFVSGNRVIGPTPVSPNDVVSVGDTTITLVASSIHYASCLIAMRPCACRILGR